MLLWLIFRLTVDLFAAGWVRPRRCLRASTSPRLIAQAGIVQHRPFQRCAGRQALDFLGNPRLISAIESRSCF